MGLEQGMKTLLEKRGRSIKTVFQCWMQLKSKAYAANQKRFQIQGCLKQHLVGSVWVSFGVPRGYIGRPYGFLGVMGPLGVPGVPGGSRGGSLGNPGVSLGGGGPWVIPQGGPPQGAPRGPPQGALQGTPQGTHGVPLGNPQGSTSGISRGYPWGYSWGYPRGYPRGYPLGYPRGYPWGYPGDMPGDISWHVPGDVPARPLRIGEISPISYFALQHFSYFAYFLIKL